MIRFLKRLGICIATPIIIPIALLLSLAVILVMFFAGCFQWLITGKKTIIKEFDKLWTSS